MDDGAFGCGAQCLIVALPWWLGEVKPDSQTILCIPAQSTGTWLAAAVLAAEHALLFDAECNVQLERVLALLPLKQRIKKNQVDFRRHEHEITRQWRTVTQVCSQARAFEQAVRRCLNGLPPAISA